MERLAKKIAESVGTALGKSEEEIAVMAYGWIGIIQFSVIFLLSSVFGILFGFWLEVFTVFLSVGFFSIRDEEILLYRIRDINTSRTLGQRLFGVGSITVVSSDKTMPTLVLKNIKKPMYVK